MDLASDILNNNSVLDYNIKSNEVVSFPIDNIDVSWMTKAQNKFFEVLRVEKNRDKKYNEICELAGYKTNITWYKAIKDKKFTDLIESMGVKLRLKNDNYQSHDEVKYIKNPKEREEYLNNDIWDMRILFEEYPRHIPPNKFIVDFNKIHNIQIRELVKRYYVNMLSSWKPKIFSDYIAYFSYFFNLLYKLYPSINSLDKLNREIHIESILKNMSCSKNYKKECLWAVRAMFDYMYYNKWEDCPSLSLFNKYDIPIVEKALPRPIPPNIKIQLDDYIETIIIPLLEYGKATPIIVPQYWDLLIIIRSTGRRFEDICHLIAVHKDKSKECLQYDLDRDPMLYLDHRIAKIPKDLRIPLAHLKDPKGNNIVERAILRQKERIRNLPSAPDGYNYLFREIKIDNRGLGEGKLILDSNDELIVDSISYLNFVNNTLSKISTQIPLKNIDGSIYQISAHQFRHTVATEMVDAGIDIYAVKEFLGHSSIAMTEKYI